MISLITQRSSVSFAMGFTKRSWVNRATLVTPLEISLDVMIGQSNRKPNIYTFTCGSCNRQPINLSNKRLAIVHAIYYDKKSKNQNISQVHVYSVSRQRYNQPRNVIRRQDEF